MWSAPHAIIAVPSSTMTKSRMFSQISPKERGNSVPSPEYSQISAWTACASCSFALRVRKCRLLELAQAGARISESSLDLLRGCAARNIVLFDNASEFKSLGKVVAQQITEFATLACVQ